MSIFDKLFSVKWLDDVKEVDVGRVVIQFADITNGDRHEHTVDGYILAVHENLWIMRADDRVKSVLVDGDRKTIQTDDGTYISHLSGRYTAKIVNRISLIKRYQVGKLRFFGIPDGVTYRELD